MIENKPELWSKFFAWDEARTDDWCTDEVDRPESGIDDFNKDEGAASDACKVGRVSVDCATSTCAFLLPFFFFFLWIWGGWATSVMSKMFTLADPILLFLQHKLKLKPKNQKKGFDVRSPLFYPRFFSSSCWCCSLFFVLFLSYFSFCSSFFSFFWGPCSD